jgi:hypothetical protein
MDFCTMDALQAVDWGLRVALPSALAALPDSVQFVRDELRSIEPIRDDQAARTAAAALSQLSERLAVAVTDTDRQDIRRLDALLQARSAVALANVAAEFCVVEAQDDQYRAAAHETVRGLAGLAVALGVEDVDVLGVVADARAEPQAGARGAQLTDGPD